jgi:hypothetical protein
MIRSLMFALVLLGTGVAAMAPAAARAQLPTIYVDPGMGAIDDSFVFYGSGFTPGMELTVWFVAPEGTIFDLVDNPLLVQSDGTFRLPILPAQDLGLVPGFPATVPLGRWIAHFQVPDETYYEATFVVLP